MRDYDKQRLVWLEWAVIAMFLIHYGMLIKELRQVRLEECGCTAPAAVKESPEDEEGIHPLVPGAVIIGHELVLD